MLWIKNHGIPLKSNIKVFSGKIFLVNQDNRILCLKTSDGSMLWNYRSVSSFIKSQHFLSTAITESNDLIVLNSAGELTKMKTDNGDIYWTLSTLGSLYAHDTDFFASSDIVINNNEPRYIIRSIKNFDDEFNNLNKKIDIFIQSDNLVEYKDHFLSNKKPSNCKISIFLNIDNKLINLNSNGNHSLKSYNQLDLLKNSKKLDYNIDIS